jgi:hypothetical protein
MPIFSRRRLQAMLDDLAPHLTSAKSADLVARLDHKDTQLALAGETELALIWAVGQVADLTVEPALLGAPACPDVYSLDLFRSGPAVIEITALSDDTFSGQKDMDRAANILVNFANRTKKDAGKNLYFEFMEAGGYENGCYQRRRRVTPDFRLTSDLENALRGWLLGANWPEPNPIRLTDPQIDVVAHWKQFVHPQFRTFSSMPAVASDIEDNPLFKALRKKERQLSSVPEGMLKCIFLGDAGCRNLRHLRSSAAVEVSGDKIIRYFLGKSSIDVVCVFSPHHSNRTVFPSFASVAWSVEVYERRPTDVEDEYAKLKTLTGILPQPNLEAYTARALHRQGAFHHQARGHYLGMHISSRRSSVTAKISSRLLQEFLAGRISKEHFQHFAFGKDRNLFEHWLKIGFTIQGARLDKTGIQDDDDYIVFDFAADVSAMPLKKPDTAA